MTHGSRVNVRRMLLLREPPGRVWTALRDDLPAVAGWMSGIASIRRLEVVREAPDLLLTVHEWRATASLPGLLDRHSDGGAVQWVERARWMDGDMQSHWTVESRILGGGLTASGLTHIEPAMGGRGSRLHFEISASLGAGALGPLGEGRWRGNLEDAAAGLLARTLQDLGESVERFLKSGGGQPGGGNGTR